MNGNDRQRSKLLREVIDAVLAGIRTRQAESQAEALHPCARVTELYFTRDLRPVAWSMGLGQKFDQKGAMRELNPRPLLP